MEPCRLIFTGWTHFNEHIFTEISLIIIDWFVDWFTYPIKLSKQGNGVGERASSLANVLGSQIHLEKYVSM